MKRGRKGQKTRGLRFFWLLLLCLVLTAACRFAAPGPEKKAQSSETISLEVIPSYTGSPYTIINDNIPFFTEEEMTAKSYETYSPLDRLGRCGVVQASIGRDLMPTEKRGSIGQVKPTGWQAVKYSGIVDGNYLYNRCHLIGYQLTAENANERNLITGTRYMNVEGMLPFEDMTADYVKETGNHVLYRVTPMFHGQELVARGVLMEGKSVEDEGEGLLFNVFCYNVQPQIQIDYVTGDSQFVGPGPESQEAAVTYVLNKGTKKFHRPSCLSVEQMEDSNRATFTGTREEALAAGYAPCGRCRP